MKWLYPRLAIERSYVRGPPKSVFGMLESEATLQGPENYKQIALNFQPGAQQRLSTKSWTALMLFLCSCG